MVGLWGAVVGIWGLWHVLGVLDVFWPLWACVENKISPVNTIKLCVRMPYKTNDHLILSLTSFAKSQNTLTKIFQ